MSVRKHVHEENSQYAAQSMAGHVSIKDMGTSVSSDAGKPVPRSRKASPPPTLSEPPAASTDFFDTNLESISYRPKSAATRRSFDALTAAVREHIPDESHSVILSAADGVLEILKDGEKDIAQKREALQGLLSVKLSDGHMTTMTSLAREITDYDNEDQDSPASDVEVAIAFEDEETDALEDRQEYLRAESHAAAEMPAETAVMAKNSDELLEGAGQSSSSADNDGSRMADGSVVISSDSRPDVAPTAILRLEDVTEDLLFNKMQALEPEAEREHVIEKCKKVSRALVENPEDLEAELVQILSFKHLEFVKYCIQNRQRLVYGLKLRSNRAKAIELMQAEGATDLLQELGMGKRKHSGDDGGQAKKRRPSASEDRKPPRQPQLVDLESLTFEKGPQLMATAKVVLPKGSYQQNKKLYDTIHIPAPSAPPGLDESNEKLVPISELPTWAQGAFPDGETRHLNRIQSKIYPSAFHADENLLLCAPTGAGKTNVAMLATLRVLANHRHADGKFDMNSFKIVYVAPLKALVSEQMREFRRRLTTQFGVIVNEFTGDATLSQREIADTQVLVTTPEKWDVATRAAHPYTRLVRLLIVDEIHLLHDDRGPVLESIIVRAKRNSETRLVGLSATLPNYEDVAQFLGVNLKTGLFYFDARYRPCPLEQEFIGIKEKKAILKVAAMNDACHEKMMQCRKNGHQLIIFVHSRKDTVKTAKWLAEKAQASETAMVDAAGTAEILKQEAGEVKNANLAEILPSGFGVHHAGLDKADRALVEDLFAQGHLQVLVSTATLAWGVNLPAHTVIIKGTETYNPEKGAWVQLSPQDILQMLGRAGRPRYDVSGEGVIITSHDELQYYMAILNQQLPIESQFMRKMLDNLNAEIVLGSIRTRDEAVEWLGQTYLYVRMLKSPRLYQVGAAYSEDSLLQMKRMDLVHSALVGLNRDRLVQYDEVSGRFASTDLGKIAAQFYIGHESMAIYDQNLKPWMSQIDILRIFSGSGEFKYVPVRSEEKIEVVKLSEKCPIPIKESASDARTKVNVLLQAYISRHRLEGFALLADMIYIRQSAGRLLRALHQLCLKRKWAQLALDTLDLCKFVEQRMWNTNSPFRQYGPVANAAIIKATESSHLPFSTYFHLSAAELSEAINFKGNSQLAHDLLRQFPKVAVSCVAQPISPEMMRVSVDLVADWTWNRDLHGASESFLLLAEDTNGETLLYEEKLRITKKMVNRELHIDFTIPTSVPLPPALFVTVVSEKWLHSQWREPVKMFDVKVPKAPHSVTPVLDVQSIPVKALGNQSFVEAFGYAYFNKYLSQGFDSLWNTNESVFFGVSKGSGKTSVAELAILNAWRQNKQRILYLTPNVQKIERQLKIWASIFGPLTNPPKVVGRLSGDPVKDTRVLAQSHLVLSTPEYFDAISRRWRQRKPVQLLDTIIADDVHMLDGVYETVLTRARFMVAHLEREIRIVVLSNPLLYARELSDWLGISKKHVYNFSPLCRASAIQEIKIMPYENLTDMAVKKSDFARDHDFSGRQIVFLADKRAAVDLVPTLLESKAGYFDRTVPNEVKAVLSKLRDRALAKLLEKGVAIYDEMMDPRDRALVERLASEKHIPLILASKGTCGYAPRAEIVVIYGSQVQDGVFVTDYYLSEFLEMVGCAEHSVLAYIYGPKVAYYSEFLKSPMPVESTLSACMAELFMHEIAARTFHTKQDCVDYLTYTFFYRRVMQNPSFYGVKDVSHVGISEYLSELVESTLEELEQAGLIEIEENSEDPAEHENPADHDDEDEVQETIAPLNGAMIAAHYSVAFASMKNFSRLGEKARLRSIIESVTSASEFDNLIVRDGEEELLVRLAQKVPLKLAPESDFESPHAKAFLLLQAHFSRIAVPAQLKADQRNVLKKALSLVHAIVDTLSSEGYLNAVQAMDLSQMIVQGIWTRDSPLWQIPHMDAQMMQRCAKYKVETVYDVMALEDDERDDVLRLKDDKLQEVAEFVNKFPNVDVRCHIDEGVMKVDEQHVVTVVLERDEEMDDLEVKSQLYPFPKTESWWVVIGDADTRQLYAIKKTPVMHEVQEVKLDVVLPTPGRHTLSIWCMCDSYVDADKEMQVQVECQEAITTEDGAEPQQTADRS